MRLEDHGNLSPDLLTLAPPKHNLQNRVGETPSIVLPILVNYKTAPLIIPI